MKLYSSTQNPSDCEAAHVMFSADQAFLWLPGLPGDEVAFCTYNHPPGHAVGAGPDGKECHADANGAPWTPPDLVSRESFILWDRHASPPFPYHPVAIKRSLTREETAELGRQVASMAGTGGPVDDAVSLLRNDNKCAILTVLSQMGLLAGPSANRS